MDICFPEERSSGMSAVVAFVAAWAAVVGLALGYFWGWASKMDLVLESCK